MTIDELRKKKLPDLDKTLFDDVSSNKIDDMTTMHTTIMDNPNFALHKQKIMSIMSKDHFAPLDKNNGVKIKKMLDDDGYGFGSKELFSKKDIKKISRFF